MRHVLSPACLIEVIIFALYIREDCLPIEPSIDIFTLPAVLGVK